MEWIVTVVSAMETKRNETRQMDETLAAGGCREGTLGE
jgi:hypothetical protein